MSKQFDLLPFLLVLLRRKWFLAFNLIIAIGAGVWYAFVAAPKQYLTTITFLPPADNGGVFNFLPSFSLGGSLSRADIMPEQIVSIFKSQVLHRSVADRFNLIEKYKLTGKPFRYKVALKKLEKDLEIETNEVGNLGITKLVSFTISAYHTSADTSYDMAVYVFAKIDSVIRDISTGRGRTNRLFIENQVAKNKLILDSLQQAFKEFQQKYKAYNIPEQLNVTLKNYGQIKALLLSNEFRIHRLEQDFASNHPEVEALRKSNSVLLKQLTEIEKNTSPEVMVGLELSTDLVPRFTNLYRDIEVQNQLILFLAQELEQSKITEARDISTIKQIDPPFKPLYKARPKRVVLLGAIVTIYMLTICLIVLLQHAFVVFVKPSRAYHEILAALRH